MENWSDAKRSSSQSYRNALILHLKKTVGGVGGGSATQTA